MQHIILEIIGAVLLIGVSITSWIMYVWNQAKKEVKQIPRVPMLLCDIHGAYPEHTALTIDADVTGGVVKLCPFCMRDRVGKKKAQ